MAEALAARRREIVLASTLASVHQVGEVLVPVTIGVIIDSAIASGDAGSVVRWLAVLAVQFALLSGAGCAGLFVEERARLRACHDTRVAVARRVLDPRGAAAPPLAGRLVSLSTIESMRIGEGVTAVIVAAGAIAGMLAGAVVLFATSVWLGLAVVVGLPVVLLAVQVVSAPVVARADAHQEATGVAAGVAADLLGGLRVLKGLGAEVAASAGYRRASRSALTAALGANRIRAGYAGVLMTVGGGFVVLVAWLGGQLALDGHISAGSLIAALGVTQFLVGPLGRLAYAGGLRAQAAASADHLDALLDAPPVVEGGRRALDGDPLGSLRLDALTAGALTGVALDVHPGEMVGVVATDPGEAALLVDLLDRSVAPADGSIAVDGIDVDELTLDDARRALVVAHHEAPLFAGTIGDNVGEAAPPGVALDRAVAAAGLDDVVAAAPHGLATPVTESGRSLSGGQRQRVALARALAADAPLLVLHEPTTAVDAATEHRIAAGLRDLRRGRTTVLVTSSPALLAATDRVALLHEGAVAALATHDHLARHDATYRAVVLR